MRMRQKSCALALVLQRPKRMKKESPFFKGGHGPTPASAFLYFDLSFIVWVFLWAVGNYVEPDRGLTPMRKAALTAIPLLGGSILRFLFATLTGFFAREVSLRRTERSSSTLLSVLKKRDTYLFGLFYGVAFGGFAGLANFLSNFLRGQYGFSRIEAGGLTLFCVLAGSLLRPAGGLLAKRLGGLPMLVVLYSVLVLLGMLAAQSIVLTLAVAVLCLIMACL